MPVTDGLSKRSDVVDAMSAYVSQTSRFERPPLGAKPPLRTTKSLPCWLHRVDVVIPPTTGPAEPPYSSQKNANSETG